MLKYYLFALVSFGLVCSQASAQEAKTGAQKHQQAGVVCQTCHGPDIKNPVFPEEAVCVQCHPKDALIQKKAFKDVNPHNAPHNGDCTLCHMQHEKPVNYCAQCHNFNFNVK